MNLSIIIPSYNEEERLTKTLTEIISYLQEEEDLSYEIILIDDGSQDRTLEICTSYSRKYAHIKTIHTKKNKGKGFAVKSGVQQARGDQILFMDADHSVHIKNIPKFLDSQLKNDLSVASIYIGDMETRDDNALWRKILRKTSYKIPKILLKIPVYDTQRGFKMFSKNAAHLIFQKQTISGFGFDIELLVLANQHKLVINEIPVPWDNPRGKHVKFSTYLKILIDILNIFVKLHMNRYVK